MKIYNLYCITYLLHKYIYNIYISCALSVGLCVGSSQIVPTAFPSLSELQTLISFHTERKVLFNAINTF